MTVYAITDTKKGRTGIAPTYLHTTPGKVHTNGSHSFTCNYTNACLYLVSVHQINVLH